MTRLALVYGGIAGLVIIVINTISFEMGIGHVWLRAAAVGSLFRRGVGTGLVLDRFPAHRALLLRAPGGGAGGRAARGQPGPGHQLGAWRSGGPALGVAFVDTHETRVLFGANYMPLGNTIDVGRFVVDFEVSWRFLSFHVNGATATRLINGVSGIGWQLGLYVGVRGAW